MKFEKGKSGNPNGRPPGAKNKNTEEIREMVQSFIETNIKKLQSDYDQLAPKERLLFIEKLLTHILPRPLNELERLTDEQLDEIIKRLKSQHNE